MLQMSQYRHQPENAIQWLLQKKRTALLKQVK